MPNDSIHIGLIDTGVDPEYMGLFRYIEAFQHIDKNGELTDAPCHDNGSHGTFNAALMTQKWCSDAGELQVLPTVPVRLHVCAAISRVQTVPCILEALQWMLEQPIHILVLPLGIPEQSHIFQPHIQLLLDKGVLPIAAVGNDGAGRSRSPGFYDSVLSIGACSWSGEVPAFSGSAHPPGLTRCLKPDLVAPGVGISLKKNHKIQTLSGTSMACAIAVRYAARLWMDFPEKSAFEVRRALTQSAQALAHNDSHRCRYGRIDLNRACQELSLPPMENVFDAKPPLQEIMPWIDPKVEEFVHKNAEISQILMLLREGTDVEELLSDDVRLVKSYKGTSIVLIQSANVHLQELIQHSSVLIAQATDTSLITLSA